METGTPALRSRKKNLTSIPAVEKQQLLEQVDVLLVLEQRAVQGRNELLRIVAAQHLGRNLLGHQQLYPIQEFGGGGFLLQAGGVANLEERRQRLVQQFALQAREMHVDDLRHRGRIRKADVMEKAAPQKRVRQFLFVVAGDHDDRPMLGAHRFTRFVDVELHAIQFTQQIVRKFDVRLVDLIDEQHGLHVAVECLPQVALHDVIVNVLDARIAELRIAKARHRVIFVQSLLRLGGGLDVPLEERLG